MDLGGLPFVARCKGDQTLSSVQTWECMEP